MLFKKSDLIISKSTFLYKFFIKLIYCNLLLINYILYNCVNLLLFLFFLFLQHFLAKNAMCYIQLFHQHSVLYFPGTFLLHYKFRDPNIPSNPLVSYPRVFKSSCAINTYTLNDPLFSIGYPPPEHAGGLCLLSKCTHVGDIDTGST